MNYAIKTSDNTSIFAVVINGEKPHGQLPVGKTPEECGMWPVDITIPSGFRQDYSKGTPPGWQLVSGIVTPYISPIPEPIAPSQEVIWQNKLAGRIIDEETGIQIEAKESVRNLLTGQLVMITTALSIGKLTTETLQEFWDADGTKHILTVADLIGLILRYGIAWQAMHSEFAP